MSVCTGSGIVLSDIPSSDRERDAWKAWNTDRKRAAIRTVLHRVVIKPLPAGVACNPRQQHQGRLYTANGKWRARGNASNSTGAY
jgi:hypothetical protein